ncbi:MAG: methyltransferase domain-containing protein [Planctomycetota bacterium]
MADRLAETGCAQVAEYRVDVQKYLNYTCFDRHNPPDTLHEKALEYFLSEEVLQFHPQDCFIDIASLTSPFPDHVRSTYRCTVLRQDLYHYPPGINGDRIGGDACNLPLPPACCTKLSLHCSYEHFEGDSDTRFILEAARVMKPGGRMFIGPLYLGPAYTIEYEDGVSVGACKKPHAEGCRFARTYDIPRLVERVLKPARECFTSVVYRLCNLDELTASMPPVARLYCNFFIVLTRK